MKFVFSRSDKKISPAETRPLNPPKPLFWLWLILMVVFFTPTLRLPGGIPLRIDDVMVGGMGLFIIGRSLLRFRVPRLDGVALTLIVMAITMLGSTIIAGQLGIFPIGVKEYLDLIRPLKFLFLYVAIQEASALQSLEALRKVNRTAIIWLTIFALMQLLLLNPGSQNFLAKFFLLYTDLKPEHARSFFGLRPFATFQTPTDLGYVMTVFLAGCVSFRKREPWGSRLLCLLGIVVSGTRTFLFALPLFFGMYAVISARSFGLKITRLFWSLGILGFTAALLLLVLPIVSPNISLNIVRSSNALATGNYAEDQSIETRLHKLELVVYTWNHARYMGVVTRQMLGSAADSEYVYTFNRYGLIGIAELLAIYICAYFRLRKLRKLDREVYLYVGLTLFATFIYGFTQGALIDTRVGVLPIAVLSTATAYTKLLTSRDASIAEVSGISQ